MIGLIKQGLNKKKQNTKWLDQFKRMKIKLLVVGKTDDQHLEKLILTYKKLQHYISFEIEVILI